MKKVDKKLLSAGGHIKAFTSVVLPKLEVLFSTFILQYPYWTLAINEAIGLYGFYMACKQEEVNEYVEFIKSHPKEFRRGVVESKEFRDGFVLAFQEYLKMRTAEKRKIAKDIFLGFSKSDHKLDFELEMLNDALLKISSKTLITFSFIKKKIIPLKEKSIREGLKNKNIQNSDKNEEWWFQLDCKRESLSKFIDKWISENFNPNSDIVKRKYNVTGDWDKKLIASVFDLESEEREKFNSAVEELVQLGIFKIRINGGGGIGSSASAEYDFTHFGYRFVEYLSE